MKWGLEKLLGEQHGADLAAPPPSQPPACSLHSKPLDVSLTCSEGKGERSWKQMRDQHFEKNRAESFTMARNWTFGQRAPQRGRPPLLPGTQSNWGHGHT